MVSTLHYVANWLNAISFKKDMQSLVRADWGEFYSENKADLQDSEPAIRTAGIAYILQQFLPIINARI